MTATEKPSELALLGAADRIAALAAPVRVLGIDLGTTNCTAAEVVVTPGSPPGAPTCLDYEQETLEGKSVNLLVPSVVAEYRGKRYVGEGAKRLRSRSSEFGLRRNRDLFYEVKNDIGLRRTYHLAPPGLRSAREVSRVLLEYLAAGATTGQALRPVKTVVTVPASFNAAQRLDTLRAAEAAGLALGSGDLLDEPVAAFLDHLRGNLDALLPKLADWKKLLVFDFGGGTCDVAVLELRIPSPERREIRMLSVSRYHRLGGGDLDAAIVHQVLVPALLAENRLDRHALDFSARKQVLEPALLGVAEALKIGLCLEIARLQGFGKYADADRDRVVKTNPGTEQIVLGGRQLTLTSPSLTARRFEEVLQPFLDRDLMYARDTGYYTTCSIFAPLADALDRANLAPAAIDFCLLTGGSSLIPPVRAAVADYFPKAALLGATDPETVQTAIARGAAWHALARTLTGSGIFSIRVHDRISIRTESGTVELIPAGATLPYLADGVFAECRTLAIPKSTVEEEGKLRLELAAGPPGGERLLLTVIWAIPPGFERGTPLLLRHRMDENQVLELELRVDDPEADEVFTLAIENPFSHVVRPDEKREAAERLEEELRTQKKSPAQVADGLVRLGDLCTELRQEEKALECFTRAQQIAGEPDAEILNRMGLAADHLGDFVRAEKFYREAAAVTDWCGPLFNLALFLKKRNDLPGAIAALETALARHPAAPYFILRAQLAEAAGDSAGRQARLAEGLAKFEPLTAADDWALGWHHRAAQMAGDSGLMKKIDNERRRRTRGGPTVAPEGDLPITTADHRHDG